MDRIEEPRDEYQVETGAGLVHEDLTRSILGACFEVMNELGAGLLESVYEAALVIALKQRSLDAQPQVPLEVKFRGEKVGKFFADILVEGKVIVELKSVDCLLPEHQAQTINYLKATGTDVGLLVNFGKPKLQYKRLHR